MIDVSVFKPSIHHCVHETWKVYPLSPYCILYRETHWVLFPSSRSIVFAHSRLRRTAGLEKGSFICPHNRKGVSALKTAWDISQWKKKDKILIPNFFLCIIYVSEWWWLPLRLSKCQSPLPTTVLLGTTLTRTIKLHYYNRLNGSLSLLVIIINGVSQMHQWQHIKTHLWKRTNEYSLFGASCLINLSAWRRPKV